MNLPSIIFRIDPTGEFSRRWESNGCCGSTERSAVSLIKGEIACAINQAKIKFEKLQSASSIQVGLELLHLFVLDLLGRDTFAAKIYMAKTGQM